jgi:predicted dehydrogenase
MHDKVAIGQFGCGYWGPNLVRNFYKIPEVKRLVVCDSDQKVLSRIHAEYPTIETTDSADGILKDPSIDAVVVALPAGLHYEYTRKALLADKHVLVEKPLAMSSDQANELIQISAEKQKKIMIGHTFIYNSAVRKIKQYIDSGELGDIYYIFSQRLNLGKVRKDVNAMWNLAPHDISIILYWLSEEPSKVFARGVSFLQEGIEDLVFLHLNFPSGKSAHIHVSWLNPRKTREALIVGSKKMLLYNDTSTESKITIYDKGIDKTLKDHSANYLSDFALFNLRNRVGDVLIPKVDFDEPLKIECRHFVDCIQNGKMPLTGGLEGLQVVKILEDAQKSLAA